jgi:hypothetical protein
MSTQSGNVLGLNGPIGYRSLMPEPPAPRSTGAEGLRRPVQRDTQRDHAIAQGRQRAVEDREELRGLLARFGHVIEPAVAEDEAVGVAPGRLRMILSRTASSATRPSRVSGSITTPGSRRPGSSS